tara:strand:- start:7882 stop:8571 length:690 start_codon:yes stop_codon:yes gene_type:complete
VRGLGTLIAVGLLLAQPAFAFTPERAAILVDAVRENGCRMDGAEAPAALEPLGLDSIEVQSIVDILYGADLVTISGDQQTLILDDTLCAAQGDEALALVTAAYDVQEASLEPWRPDFPAERGAALIGIVRGNDCALTEEEAGQLLPGAGFDPVLTRDIVTVMLDTGLVTIDPEIARIQLSDGLCAADAASDEATVSDAVALWIEANAGTNASGGPNPAPAQGPAREGDQ